MKIEGLDPSDKISVAVNDLGTKKIYVHLPSWKMMDATNRATLLLHESQRLLHLVGNPGVPFNDHSRAITGLIMNGKKPGASDPFMPYYEGVRRLSPEPVSSVYLSKEEKADRVAMLTNRKALLELFSDKILNHPSVKPGGNSLSSILHLEKKLFGAEAGQAGEQLKTLAHLPISKRAYWVFKGANPELVWLPKLRSASESDQAAIASLLNREIGSSLLEDFERSGDAFVRSGSISAEMDFLRSGEALRGLMTRLYSTVTPIDISSRFEHSDFN